MKTIISLCLALLVITSCKSYDSKQIINNENEDALVESDTVSISGPDTDYEIIIIEPGFNSWLLTTARPEQYYSQSFLEQRNAILVREWNLRNMQPTTYNSDLYELRIDYDTRTDYGYEVNYKLYNYFVYFQLKYKQRLSAALNPRI